MIILASQSEARKRLLLRLGLEFEIRPAHLNEEKIGRQFKQPKQRVRELARLKARSVFDENPNATVIGSDQMLVCAGKIYGKPGTAARARRQLSQFSGKTIKLLTAVSILSRDGEAIVVHETKMKFRKLTQKEIASYVERDQPLECAGSFKFESLGISLFDSVETNDPTAIEGLPLIWVAKQLRG